MGSKLLKGSSMGIISGTTIGVIKGDARIFDIRSCGLFHKQVIPTYTPKCYNPSYPDPQKRTPFFDASLLVLAAERLM